MKYLVRSGNLYNWQDGQPASRLAYLSSPFYNTKKSILEAGGAELSADIKTEKSGLKTLGHNYILCDKQGNTIAEGTPEYSEEDDPNRFGWPISHAPHVDHVKIFWNGDVYRLNMLNSQNYRMVNFKNETILEIIHHGLGGGWMIETKQAVPSGILLGFFLFCRYLEQENEFIVV